MEKFLILNLLSQTFLHVVHIDDDPSDPLLVEATHLLTPEEVSHNCCHLQLVGWPITLV